MMTKNVLLLSRQPMPALAALICFIFFSISTAGCGKSDSPAKTPSAKKAPLVTTASAEIGEITRRLSLNGTIEAYRMARLASPAEGPIINLAVREGDAVNAGDILVTIGRKTGVEALIASLREALKKEEDNLNRTRRLVESNALPGEQLDIAKANFERVRAELARARESERDYEVSAPFSGMVSKLLVNEGDFVIPRAGLVEIYDPATLVLRAAVPERFAARLTTEMSAGIHLDAYPARSFTGRISRLYPYLDGQMRTRTIEIEINEPADLLPGMFGRIQLELQSFPDAVIIPSQAVLVTPKGDSILFVIDEDKGKNTAIQRKITAGIEENGHLQILSGVHPGDQVIISGQEKLKDGATVRLPGPASGDKTKAAGKVLDSGKPDEMQAGER